MDKLSDCGPSRNAPQNSTIESNQAAERMLAAVVKDDADETRDVGFGVSVFAIVQHGMSYTTKASRPWMPKLQPLQWRYRMSSLPTGLAARRHGLQHFLGGFGEYCHAQPAGANGPRGPATAQVAYPYYTARGPRDFFVDNPPTIGR